MKRRQFIKSTSFAAGGFTLIKQPPDTLTSNSSGLEEVVRQYSPENDKLWEIIRNQFLLPRDYIYVNTGGLGASPVAVLEDVQHNMHQAEIRPNPGHDLERWNQVKDKCAGIFGRNCQMEEIALTSSTTEGNNIVINGLPLERGDEVITSTHEHAGLNIPLLNKMQRDGIVLKTFEPDLRNGLNNVNRIEDLITKQTRLIFISHVTCTTGQRFPETAICELARDKGIWTALDGAQSAGGMPLDLNSYGCDFYTTSGHKWLIGPKRTGILYVREDMLETLRPTTVGSYSDDGYDLTQRQLSLNPTAQRYEYATQNESLVHGLESAIDFVNTIGIETIRGHNRDLAEMFYQRLQGIPGVSTLSPAEEQFRTSIITFQLAGIEYREVAYTHLMGQNIRARGVGEADLGGIRVSFHLYNTNSEVNRILEAIRKIARG